MFALKGWYIRISCSDVMDIQSNVVVMGQLLRLPVLFIAENPAHVCYRKGNNVTQGYLRRRVSNRTAFNASAIQSC